MRWPPCSRLSELTENPDPSAALYGRIALVAIKPDQHPANDVISVLIETLQRDETQSQATLPEISKLDAVVMLGRIGPEAKAAVPALMDLSWNAPNEELYDAAIAALKKIQPEVNQENP